MILTLFGGFALFLVFNLPIALSLGLSAVVALKAQGDVPLLGAVQLMFTATDSFPLMAVPFFMLAGGLMNCGGISERLVRFALSLVGFIRGGLAMVAVLASMFFAGVSGSAAADTAAVGTVLIPSMRKKGYHIEFAAALQAAAGSIGVIIPPSIPMVLVGVIGGISIGGLFLGGFIPGVIIGLTLMAIAYLYAKKRGYPQERRATLLEALRAFKEAILALLMPLIIVGGILGGFFTPTESAAVAVIYALIVGLFVYRELKWSDLPRILVDAAVSTAVVMFVIACASIFGWVLARERIPQEIAAYILNFSRDPRVIFLLINILLLIVGCFLETAAALIILIPVLLPVISQVGIDPLHFGVVAVVNLAIGMLTPPVGICLYVSSGIAGIPMERISRAIVPFVAVMVVDLFLITYFPSLVMVLPRLFMG